MKPTTLFLWTSTLLCSLDANAFSIHTRTLNRSCIQSPSILKSTPAEGEDQSLVLGNELSNALSELGSEEGYLDAAKKRAEEGKAKLMEQVRLEEEEAERKRKLRAESNPDNSGPADMSTYVGFTNDGFEESEADNRDGLWQEAPTKEEGEEDPKLLLFDENEGDADNGGLIV